MPIESIFGVLNDSFTLCKLHGEKFTCTERFHFSNMKHSESVEQNAQKLRMHRGSKTAESQNFNAEENQCVQIS